MKITVKNKTFLITKGCIHYFFEDFTGKKLTNLPALTNIEWNNIDSPRPKTRYNIITRFTMEVRRIKLFSTPQKRKYLQIEYFGKISP